METDRKPTEAEAVSDIWVFALGALAGVAGTLGAILAVQTWLG